jgi:hypothetical protein
MREGLLILCQILSEKILSQKTAQKSANAQILEFAEQNSAKLKTFLTTFCRFR